jgi:hypothetical protein
MRISLKPTTCDIPKYHNTFETSKTFDKLKQSQVLHLIHNHNILYMPPIGKM